MEHSIQAARADLKWETIREGSPHGLSCQKTSASYDRRVAQRQQDLSDLAVLKDAGNFAGHEASALMCAVRPAGQTRRRNILGSSEHFDGHRVMLGSNIGMMARALVVFRRVSAERQMPLCQPRLGTLSLGVADAQSNAARIRAQVIE